jgi:hypothetical protein
MPTTRSLEERIQAIEDRLEIYNDRQSPAQRRYRRQRAYLGELGEDGVFDRGENLSSPRGRASIAEQVLTPRIRLRSPADWPISRPAACRDLR